MRDENQDPKGYHRKAGQKGTQFLFVSSNLSRLKRVPTQSKQGMRHGGCEGGSPLSALGFPSLKRGMGDEG
jgi:hypothetical protein